MAITRKRNSDSFTWRNRAEMKVAVLCNTPYLQHKLLENQPSVPYLEEIFIFMYLNWKWKMN